MGTRADFYVGKGAGAEWIGSITYDGDPDGSPGCCLGAKSEAEWRERVAAMLADLKPNVRTCPSEGWPWPWDDSRMTDYAYTFDQGQAWISSGYHAWFAFGEEEDFDSPPERFPNMRARRNDDIVLAKSGLIILGVPKR
jgi:hypothetical protein